MRNLFPLLAIALAALSLVLTLSWSKERIVTRAEKERAAMASAERDQAVDAMIQAHGENDRNWARARDLRAALNAVGYDLPEESSPPSN